MTLSPRTRLRHYEILAPLGAGGLGEVFLARNTKLERQVAIKLLTAEFSTNADRLHRFIQEAKAASALNHPNILTIYEIGETGGKHYIATEYIEGQTLRHHIQHSHMKILADLDIVVQVASALATAHQAGIIHLIAAIGSSYWYFIYRSSSARQIESIAVMPFVIESGHAEVDQAAFRAYLRLMRE